MLSTRQKYLPKIIQGGMGVGVSGWELARAVSLSGQLGVVSGTAIDQILARKLQLGDPGGHLRRAMARFPDPEMARRVQDAFYLPLGKTEQEQFKSSSMFTLNLPSKIKELTVVAAFCEVFLAKEGHDQSVGMNLLEKIQLPNLFTIYGAMLAGVDYIFMGAGIPKEIPGIIDRLAGHLDVSLKISVEEASAADEYRLHFNPRTFIGNKITALKRPLFIPIISSATLATMMHKKANGKINGFVIETASAGGHNAPPRGKSDLTPEGEPIYGKRDEIEIDKIKSIGLPFWLAGSWCSPEKLVTALSLGAQGIQAGTAFAFCREAGISDHLKRRVLDDIRQGTASVFTDAKASPTDFPFKVLGLNGSLSEKEAYRQRKRVCDLGYMRFPYVTKDGEIGYRCPAEPAAVYIAKGGQAERIENKKCLCNALFANIGLGQRRKDGYIEKPLITAGTDILSIARFLENGDSYSAGDVIQWLLSGAEG
jgi:nitronate monooxygenase